MSHHPQRGGNKHQQGTPKGEQQPLPEKCLFVRPQVQAVRIETASDDKERYADEKENRRQQLILSSNLNRITAIGAGISVFTLIALFISLNYSREATKAAISQSQTSQREFESSQRPWVSLDAQATEITVGGDGRGIFIAKYTLNNVGHSVARNVETRGMIIPIGEETGKECVVDQGWRDTLKRVQGGVVIFPGQAFISNWPAPVAIHKFDGATKIEYWVDNADSALMTPGGKHQVQLRMDINGTEAD
jgi:hypothetical protein